MFTRFARMMTKTKSLPAIHPRVTALAALLVATSSAFANLISIGVVPSTGNGLGAVNSVVTFQNTGTEVGAIGLAPGGTAARATGANAGLETISISRLNSAPIGGGGVGVPDDGTTVLMLGGALVGMTLLRRRQGIAD